MGRRTSKAELQVSGSIKLGDLRWLVEQCTGLSDTASVTVKEGKIYNQMDWSEDSITVRGDTP